MRIILVIFLMVSTVSAGMIEVIEDDPYQFIHFDNWNPAIDSLRIAVSLDLDSGYWTQSYTLRDTIDSKTFGYIEPDVDGDDNLIPGHYTGEYWITTIAYVDGEAIPSGDTSHVSVDYTVVAEKTPRSYQSWDVAGGKVGIQFGGEPANYHNGSEWTAIQTEWESDPDGFKAIRSRHHVYIDTTANIIRFSMTDNEDNLHVLRMRVGPLFFFHRPTRDTVRIASPNLNNYSMSGDTVWMNDIYPGVDCFIWSRPGGYSHRFVFSAWADSVIDDLWQSNGSNPNVFTVNTFRMFTDSLNLTMHDNDGEVGEEQDLSGHLNFRGLGKRLFGILRSNVWQDTLAAPLYRRLHRFGGQLWYLEGYQVADVVGWPDGGYQHSATASWATPDVDTYIQSGANASTSYYSNNPLVISRSGGGVEFGQTQLHFDGVIDSMSGWSSLDSSLLQTHYNSLAAGPAHIKVNRMIADGSWAKTDSQNCTYNNRYDAGAADSITWTAGLADWSSTYTSTNVATGAIADTNNSGFYQIDITDQMEDVRVAGVYHGSWLESGGVFNRTYIDGANDGGGDYPMLYIEGTVAAAAAYDGRRRKILMGGT